MGERSNEGRTCVEGICWNGFEKGGELLQAVKKNKKSTEILGQRGWAAWGRKEESFDRGVLSWAKEGVCWDFDASLGEEAEQLEV